MSLFQLGSFGYSCLTGHCSILKPSEDVKLVIVLFSSLFACSVVIGVSNFLTWRLARKSAQLLRQTK